MLILWEGDEEVTFSYGIPVFCSWNSSCLSACLALDSPMGSSFAPPDNFSVVLSPSPFSPDQVEALLDKITIGAVFHLPRLLYPLLVRRVRVSSLDAICAYWLCLLINHPFPQLLHSSLYQRYDEVGHGRRDGKRGWKQRKSWYFGGKLKMSKKFPHNGGRKSKIYGVGKF